MSLSELVIIGKLEYLRTETEEMRLRDSQVPAKGQFARIRVDSVLKARSKVSPNVNVHWRQPLSGSGYYEGYSSPPDGSYMVFFLKPDELSDTYTFASRFYAGVWATPSASLQNTGSELKNTSDEQVAHKVVVQMCRFIESPGEDVETRVQEMSNLSLAKDKVVHDTARKLVNDSNPRLRGWALFTLLRAKDASFLPVARDEISLAAKTSESNAEVQNLILAVTQEFPAADSIPIIATAASTPNVDLRRTIAYAARHTSSLAAVPILAPLVDDPDGEVAWNAMHSLGELSGHLDWRPTSHEPAEWQRCLNLWHNWFLTAH